MSASELTVNESKGVIENAEFTLGPWDIVAVIGYFAIVLTVGFIVSNIPKCHYIY